MPPQPFPQILNDRGTHPTGLIATDQTTAEFEPLLQQVYACRRCAEKLPLAPKPIFQLHPKAPILIAGQAPGLLAHQQGRPFDDPSGERLREWLGVDRKTFYNPEQIAILPLGLCYPGRGNGGDKAPRRECAPLWYRLLLERLPHRRLTLVLGRHAQQYWFGNDGLNLTGRVSNWQAYGPALLPLPHPSPRNNRWLKQHRWFEQQLLPELKQRVNCLLDQ